MKLLIKADNLWLENSRSVVFKNAHIEIKAGEFIWLEGAQASGKSMLMGILSQKRKPSKGIISSSLRAPLCNSKCTLLENESVKNNIKAVLPEKPLDDAAFTVTELLKSMNLFSLRNVPARDLSRGQRQMLNLTTFLALDTEILLFDDPMSALDNESRVLFIQAADKKHRQGAAIVISSTLPCPGICPSGTRHFLLKNGQLSEE
ncbi:ATP-binding cassette domain-containing protein [bacterium]|nr:ATP-binding cassette domain-containing protein [bacterium]MBU3955581.1 ATP-binding cassette domain-containing protein [bacterium]MBU4134261.1 ATP-binding cassette domain-containing protein [bacterium]